MYLLYQFIFYKILCNDNIFFFPQTKSAHGKKNKNVVVSGIKFQEISRNEIGHFEISFSSCVSNDFAFNNLKKGKQCAVTLLIKTL